MKETMLGKIGFPPHLLEGGVNSKYYKYGKSKQVQVQEEMRPSITKAMEDVDEELTLML